jgi:chromosome segregation ATPase
MSDVTTVSEIDRRDELREKVRALEEESSQLENEIVWLKGKLELIELERRSTSLTDKIGTLQVQKTLLEEKLSHVTETNTGELSNPSPSESTSEFQEMPTKLAETSVVTEIESAMPQGELGVSGPAENTLTPDAQQETAVPVVVASASTSEPISENQSSSPQ